MPAITPIYSGFVNGDSASSLTLAPTCTTTATSSSPVGTYPSSCSGAVDVDYAFSYTAGAVKVNAAPVPPATTTTTIPPAPPKAFPDAGLSYPDGAIVAYGGKDYVFAGGRAFAAAGSSLTGVEKVDHTQVVAAPAGATAPVTVAVRPGTLVSTKAVDGDGTLYVAGPTAYCTALPPLGSSSPAATTPPLSSASRAWPASRSLPGALEPIG